MASQQRKNGWGWGTDIFKLLKFCLNFVSEEQNSFPGANGLSKSFLERSTSDN